MIIELIGIPGVGKTYMGEKMSKKESIKMIKIEKRAEKYFFALLFFVFHPVTFWYFLYRTVYENWRNLKLLTYKTKYLFLYAVAKEQKARFYKKAIVDDGLFQFIFSIYERRVSENDLRWINRCLDKKKYFVYIVESDKEIVDRRIKKRGRMPRQIFGGEYIEKWLDVIGYNFFVIKDFVIQNYEYNSAKN